MPYLSKTVSGIIFYAQFRLNMISKIIEKLYHNVGRTNKSVRDVWLEKCLSSIPQGLKILDAGAGESPYKRYCGHLDYYAQDFGKYDGYGNKEGLQTESWDNSKLDIISDITNIPVENGSFDAIMCTEVLEHIPDPIKAIKEFGRILKPGGLLIVTAPISSLTHFAPFYFYNGFSKYFYEHYLKKNNFEVIELSYNGNYFEYIAQEIHRIPFMAKNYASFGGKIFNVIFRTLIIPLLMFLAYCSSKDSSSHEMLAFGIYIKARKIE
jgi:ubiquinone/menaquinone biosynthesis C-methylase UbiE